VAGLLAFTLIVTLVPCPTSAADAPPATRAGVPAATASRPTLAAHAAKLAAAAPARLALAQAPAAPDTAAVSDSRPFFKTKTGIAALVLMVAGAGYVAYRIPKDNEKVHSPVR
jgi:hypothetical protein